MQSDSFIQQIFVEHQLCVRIILAVGNIAVDETKIPTLGELIIESDRQSTK